MPASIKLTERITIQITGNTPKEIIQAGSFWLNDYPKACGNCSSTDISPRHRKAKGFDFFEVKCGKCHHSVKISEAKEDHSFFIRWDAKWQSTQEAKSDTGGSGKLEDEPDADWS